MRPEPHEGELTLLRDAEPFDKAEASFLRALEAARRRRAKSLELRSAMILSRLWQRQDKRTAARQTLAEVYGWFTEGFDTPDLHEDKALLDELVVVVCAQCKAENRSDAHFCRSGGQPIVQGGAASGLGTAKARRGPSP